MTRFIVVVFLIVALPVYFAQAQGRVPINQDTALAGAVTPGDAPGFPVTLTESGSYFLTADLFVASEGTSAIEVDASSGGNVTIDLNGHSLIGPFDCPEVGACQRGPGTGVSALDDVPNVTVRNGGIAGFATGVRLGPGCYVADLRLARSGEVFGNDGCIIDGVTSEHAVLALGANFGTVIRRFTTTHSVQGLISSPGSLLADSVSSESDNSAISGSLGVLITRSIGRNASPALNAGQDGLVNAALAAGDLTTGSGTLYTNNLVTGSASGAAIAGAPNHVLGEAEAVLFGDTLYDIFVEEKCVTCHNMTDPMNARLAFHVPGQFPAGTDVTVNGNCNACHDAGTGHADDWRAAPASMDWIEILDDPVAICENIKLNTPTAEGMRHHFEEDERILWAIGKIADIDENQWLAAGNAWINGGMLCE